ncbi:MAG: DUF4340 domain-containing protein [Faecousia sp.]
MKRYKRLGLLLTVLIIACIATLFLSRYEQKQEQIKNSDEIILEIPGDTVTALSWEYGEAGGLAFRKGAEGWQYEQDEAFPVSQEKVMDILSHFEAFGVRFVIEDVEDYSQYGLDKPECTLRISTEEASYEIKLGDFSKMDEQRYVDIGDGNVYLVAEDPMDYVDSALSGMIQHDDTPGFEHVVDIRFTGKENYTIDRIEDSGYSYSDEDVYFVQRNGKYLPLDKAAVTKYLNTITSLDLRDYVTYNVTQEELASYGLDDPELSVTVNYTYTDKDSGEDTQIADACVIHISRNPEELAAAEEAEAKGENAEAVSMYVRVGDSQIVYSLDSVDYGILSAASYDDLRHKEVFWADTSQITQIDITLEDTLHTLLCEEDEDGNRSWRFAREETPADSTGEVQSGAGETGFDETEPSGEASLDLTDFESALKNLRAVSFTSEDPTGKEEIRFTLHLENDRFAITEIILYRYDGTNCLCVVDGESVSLVPRSSVMDLVEAVQAFVLSA